MRFVVFVAAAVAAAAAAGAADAASANASAPVVCVPGATTGHWRKLGKGYEWVRTTDCVWTAETRADALRALAGRTLAFSGDSTSRLMMYELLLWLWGCDRGAGAPLYENRFVGITLRTSRGPRSFKGRGHVCDHVARAGRPLGRWDRTSQDFVVPMGRTPSRRDIRVQWRWAPYIWELQAAATALFAGANASSWPDVAYVNTGFWSMRNRGERVPGGGLPTIAGMYTTTEAWLTEMEAWPAQVAVKRRLVWRGTNRIEMKQGAFNNGQIAETDGILTRKWRKHGFPTVAVDLYTPGRDRKGAVFTEEGFHPKRWVYRQILKEVLQAGLNAIAARVAEERAAGGSGGGGSEDDGEPAAGHEDDDEYYGGGGGGGSGAGTPVANATAGGHGKPLPANGTTAAPSATDDDYYGEYSEGGENATAINATAAAGGGPNTTAAAAAGGDEDEVEAELRAAAEANARTDGTAGRRYRRWGQWRRRRRPAAAAAVPAGVVRHAAGAPRRGRPCGGGTGGGAQGPP
jgi:hypothetical protein